jgi:hypothetical protein
MVFHLLYRLEECGCALVTGSEGEDAPQLGLGLGREIRFCTRKSERKSRVCFLRWPLV